MNQDQTNLKTLKWNKLWQIYKTENEKFKEKASNEEELRGNINLKLFTDRKLIKIRNYFQKWIQSLRSFEVMENILHFLNEITKFCNKLFVIKRNYEFKDIIRRRN